MLLLFTLTAAAQSLEASSVAWSPDGERIAVGGRGVVVVVDVATLLEARRLPLDAGEITADFLPDGRLAASGTHTNEGRIWDAATGAELAAAASQFACADQPGASWHCDAWDRGVRVVWIGGGDPIVRVEAWDGAGFAERHRIAERRSMHAPVVVAGPGDRVVVGGDGGESLVQTERVLDHLPVGDDPAAHGFAMGEVERPLRTSGGYLRVWKGTRLVCEQMGLPARVTAAAIDRDGDVIVGLMDGSIAWLSPACEVIATATLGKAVITGVSWSPTGDRAAVIGASGELVVIAAGAATPEARATLRR